MDSDLDTDLDKRTDITFLVFFLSLQSSLITLEFSIKQTSLSSLLRRPACLPSTKKNDRRPATAKLFFISNSNL
ncbi:hypothetical protein AQUCO_01400937v1 [Aquilegia coerulea]|uniref:Uncharacterized protein n=1 Tax=Aquilegia coerulea TaxID=218851 RepID=A0A2G5DYW2_AQUCA|nr:hypothetical protein AQUCO_01400937v1 [Aquilegia coerulea]